MTKQELDTLHELLIKLRQERIKEVQEEYNITDEEIKEYEEANYYEDLYDLDDYDRLIEGCDIVLSTVEDLGGE